MLRILIGMSGCGKTHKLQEEIVHKKFEGISDSKEIYIIEREEYQEYSNIFNDNFVHVLKPSSDISFLMEKENCEIYIDCDNYEDDFMKKVADIVPGVRTNNTDITITFLEISESLSAYEKMIYENADEILIGKCCISSECRIEELLGIKLEPVISDEEFRKVDIEQLKVVKNIKTDEISSLECSDKNVSDNEIKDLILGIVYGCIMGIMCFIAKGDSSLNDPLNLILTLRIIGFIFSSFMVGASSIVLIRIWIKGMKYRYVQKHSSE